jgi:two-component system copper resistance phosphate regulon response regulator CusR
LVESNFLADIAETGEAGLRLIQNVDYDLLILDVMLPGKDGWSVISEVRSAGIQIPASLAGH